MRVPGGIVRPQYLEVEATVPEGGGHWRPRYLEASSGSPQYLGSCCGSQIVHVVQYSENIVRFQ